VLSSGAISQCKRKEEKIQDEELETGARESRYPESDMFSMPITRWEH